MAVPHPSSGELPEVRRGDHRLRAPRRDDLQRIPGARGAVLGLLETGDTTARQGLQKSFIGHLWSFAARHCLSIVEQTSVKRRYSR